MKAPPFRIKICGVRLRQDLEMIAAAEVDAIGLNFVPSSPRCVSLEQGRELAALARDLKLVSVAVTMNDGRERLDEILDQTDVDYLQLHGAELPELVAHLAEQSIIKSVSWSGLAEERVLAEQWVRSKQLSAFLVDAYAPDVGGGSGRSARWDLLNPRPACFRKQPLILAGGLTAENVGTAIEQTGCDAIDSASGIEKAPGIKDPELTVRFATQARAAFGLPAKP